MTDLLPPTLDEELERSLNYRASSLTLILKALIATEALTQDDYEVLSYGNDQLPEFDPNDCFDDFLSEHADEICEFGRASIDEYGYDLSRRTSSDRPSYFAWVLSGGGGSSELRFYVNEENTVTSISFVLKDWGAFSEKPLPRADYAWAWQVADYFAEAFEAIN